MATAREQSLKLGTANMSDSGVMEFGRSLTRGVQLLDLECRRLRDGVEYGLCNVQRQFREDVAEGRHADAPKRKLTYEPATAWLLAKRLREEFKLKQEEPYPADRRRRCDLVAEIGDGTTVWIELKFAWKNWFGYIGPTGVGGYETNSDFFFQGYLLGNHHSHSAAGDFARLAHLAPTSAHLGSLLIGFDSADSSMDTDVENLERQAAGGAWVRESPLRWMERRDPMGRCRINCWFWRHPPRG